MRLGRVRDVFRFHIVKSRFVVYNVEGLWHVVEDDAPITQRGSVFGVLVYASAGGRA